MELHADKKNCAPQARYVHNSSFKLQAKKLNIDEVAGGQMRMFYGLDTTWYRQEGRVVRFGEWDYPSEEHE